MPQNNAPITPDEHIQDHKANNKFVKESDIQTNPALDESDPNYRSQIQRSNPFSYIFFGYVLRLVKICFFLYRKNKPLESKDVLGIPWQYRPDVLGQKMTNVLIDQKKKNPNQKPDIFAAVFRTLGLRLFEAHFFEFILYLLRVIAAYFIYKIIRSILRPDIPNYMAYVWGAILAASLLIGFIVEHHAFHKKFLIPMYIKGALTYMMYAKINKLSVYSINKISNGKLINIVTNDMNMFERIGEYFSDVIIGLLGMIAATALLWHFFNVTVLVGIGYMILNFPIQIFVNNLSTVPRVAYSKATDERVKMTSELIEGIRLIKMYTWELIFRDKVKALREKEEKHLRSVRFYDSIARTVALSGQVMIPFLIFMTYNLTGGTLDLATVFPAYFLLGFMRVFSIFLIALGLAFLTEFKLLCARIAEVLDYPEIEALTFPAPKDNKHGIEFDHFSAYWTKEEEVVSQNKDTESHIHSENRPTISDVTINIKKGSLNALVGKVGSGKSSFLLSLTGEMPTTLGSLRYNGTIAYVEQEPTIFSGTIREGILFGKPYRPDFYQRVIRDCNLESDLKLFANGDQSSVGEKGVNLSGGQRARLALARAVYADADIYLLDDPLSAVDAKVAKSLFNGAISTLLKDKTVILATHQVHFVKNLANIMVMDEGSIVAQGSYEDIRKNYKDVDKVFSPEQEQEEAPKAKVEGSALAVGTIPEEVKEAAKAVENTEASGLVDSDDAGNGGITLRVYWEYFKEMGNPFMWFLLMSVIITNACANIAFGRILAAWAGQELPRNTCLAIMGSLTGLICILYFTTYRIFYAMTIRASTNYHDKMLNNLVRSPVLFFDKNPIGRILNRFANDIGALDFFVPFTLLDVIDILSVIISLLITLAVVFPWTLLISFGIFVALSTLIWVFLPAIKITKTYELMSRSPFSSEFSSTISGIIIIRSYKQVRLITNRFVSYLNENLKASIMVTTISRTLGFYVDMIYNLFSIGSLYIVIALGIEKPGLAAFGLILILNVLGVIQYGVKQIVQTHLLMSSPARVQAYCKITSEAAITLPNDAQLKQNGWPKQAEIDFNHVFMKYRPESDYVLRDLSINVKPGQKIGCVGRTGAGKSTILQVLFRMVEIDRNGDHSANTSLKIDSVDTKDVGLHLIRDNISIIPQTPFIFADTIKNNLDPLGKYTDEQLWAVLEDVNLKQQVERLENKLYTDMTNAASVFSVGQKQLICLARALLKKSNILVLDEATANVDKQTDDFIQQKIQERFSHATVFTIAHRLSTIANYDRVLVLDKGRKMEFDEPYRLLVSEIGDRNITNEHGHFASMVLNTGPIASQDILNVAKEKYYRSR